MPSSAEDPSPNLPMYHARTHPDMFLSSNERNVCLCVLGVY